MEPFGPGEVKVHKPKSWHGLGLTMRRPFLSVSSEASVVLTRGPEPTSEVTEDSKLAGRDCPYWGARKRIGTFALNPPGGGGPSGSFILK